MNFIWRLFDLHKEWIDMNRKKEDCAVFIVCTHAAHKKTNHPWICPDSSLLIPYNTKNSKAEGVGVVLFVLYPANTAAGHNKEAPAQTTHNKFYTASTKLQCFASTWTTIRSLKLRRFLSIFIASLEPKHTKTKFNVTPWLLPKIPMLE